MSGEGGDIITTEVNDEDININKYLIRSLKCEQYRLKSWIQNSLSLQCLENNLSYLVRVNRDSNGFDFKVWVESQD